MIQTVKIGDLCDQIRGVTYSKEDASDGPGIDLVPILRAGNITDAGLVFDDLVYVPRSCVAEKQMVKKHDVIVAASSGSLDVVGKTAQATCDYAGSFGAFCKVLRPKQIVEPRYFAHYFKTKAYRRIISQKAAGANINNLRSGDLEDLEIPLPAFSDQRRIADILDRADALRAKRRSALARLDELTQAIFIEMFGDPGDNPKAWPMATLADLFDIARGGSPRPIDDYITDDPNGINWIMIGDTSEGGKYISSTKKRIKPDGARRSRTVKPGDFLLRACKQITLTSSFASV
jgi:type I restriction enzyme S subunit